MTVAAEGRQGRRRPRAQGALRKVGADAADMKEVHLARGRALVPGVAQRTPVAPGALASSWAAEATKGRARIESTERYAAMIEYGVEDRGIEPARMVRDTVDASHDQISTTYEDGIAAPSASASGSRRDRERLPDAAPRRTRPRRPPAP